MGDASEDSSDGSVTPGPTKKYARSLHKRQHAVTNLCIPFTEKSFVTKTLTKVKTRGKVEFYRVHFYRNSIEL